MVFLSQLSLNFFWSIIMPKICDYIRFPKLHWIHKIGTMILGSVSANNGSDSESDFFLHHLYIQRPIWPEKNILSVAYLTLWSICTYLLNKEFYRNTSFLFFLKDIFKIKYYFLSLFLLFCRIVQLNLISSTFLTLIPYKGESSKYNLKVQGPPKNLPRSIYPISSISHPN